MKLLMLADPNSPHTVKWAKSLAKNGLDISIFGLSDFDNSLYRSYNNINVYTDHINASIVKSDNRYFSKLYYYLKALPILKKIIKMVKPDILHAHYATSYGLLGSLSEFHPFVLSVWGTDIFDFPRKSFFHKMLLKYNLSKADKLLSTSHVMAKETNIYINKKIEITPFGIDLSVFKPMEIENMFSKNDIVVGTVKTLEDKYGIEYLITAFNLVKKKHPELPLKLLIVGGGSQENKLKSLVAEFKVEKDTVFTGKVDYDEVPKYHNMLSVFVSVSVNESFGVAVIEASACEKPVVVSSVGGLPEVVEDGVTGLLVPPMDAEKTAEAIEKLIFDADLRTKLGKAGRERIIAQYNWDDNVRQMMKIYHGVLQ